MRKQMPSELNNPDWLREQYPARSLQEIADGLGISRGTLTKRMRQFSITIRGPGDHVAGVPKPKAQRDKMAKARRQFWDNLTPERRQEIASNISDGKRSQDGISPKGRRIYVPGRGRILEHRYIAEQELGHPLKPSEHVHHIDGDRLNNDPLNLMVVGNREHQTYHAQKLTEDDVREIRKVWATKTATQHELARRFGVSVSTVHRIIHRKRWRHL